VEDERTKLIETIDGLFPADCHYPRTAETGRELLEQARRDVENWRHEPLVVLRRYAQLCQEEERRQANRKAN
jgi:hypothetical protein